MGSNTKRGRRLALVLAILLTVSALAPAMTSAGALTNTYVRLNRMKTLTGTSFRLVFTTSSTVQVEDSVTIDFRAAWGGANVNVTQTVSSATCAAETGATALPSATALAASGSGTVITITAVSDLAVSTAYCVDLTAAAAVTTPAAGEYQADVKTKQGATDRDTARLALRIVGEDTITVTATVPPTFNFVLDANTTAFTTELATGAKHFTTSRTITVNTNAKTGWVAWLRNSDTNGLYSAGVNKNIAPTTPGTAVDVDASLSAEQYVWGVSGITQAAGAGVTSIAAAYDSSGATNDGSGVDNSYRQIASSNGTSQNAVVTILSEATVSPITPASSDYSDIIQVIGAGNF